MVIFCNSLKNVLKLGKVYKNKNKNMGEELKNLFNDATAKAKWAKRTVLLTELKAELETSRSSEEIENEIVNEIFTANHILSSIESEYFDNPTNPELEALYKNVKKEYKDLISSVRNALKNDRMITSSELATIQLEHSNVMQLWSNTQITEALNQAGKLARWLWFDSESLSLDAKKATNQYQEDLVKKILWETSPKWYGNGYVQWYNNEKWWNYVVKIPEFEATLRDTPITEINSKALWSYFTYLSDTWNLNQEKIIHIFGINNLKTLTDIWKNSEWTIAKTILEKNNVDFNSIINYTKYFENTQSFLDGIDQLSKDFIWENWKQKRELLWELFKVHGKEIEWQFIWELSKKIKEKNPHLSPLEIKGIIENFWKEIDTYRGDYTKLPEIYIAFGKLSTTYNLDLKINDSVTEMLKINASKLTIEIEELKKQSHIYQKQFTDIEISKNPEEKKALEEKIKQTKLLLAQKKQDLKDTQTTLKVHEAVDEKTVQKVTQEKDPKKAKEIFTTKLETLRKENKELDTYITTYEKEKKVFEEKYPELAEAPKTQEKTVQTAILPPQTLEYKNTQINYLPSENGTFTLETQNSKIEITAQELKIVENNEKALENLINFKETLDELDISKLWNIREDIFSSLKEQYPVLFNETDDFLSQKELIIFLNSLLASLDKKDYTSQNIDVIKTNIFSLNNASVFWGTNNENQVNGNSSLEQEFLTKFSPIENNGRFESSKFREAIS